MPSLVTRFHLLLFGVTLAIAGVAIMHVPEGFAFPAHWQGSGADWLWPRDLALAVAPLVELLLMAGFFLLGRVLTKNHLAKTRHILDPVLTLLLAVVTSCQFGLLLIGIGSDFDMFRITTGGLAATLGVIAAVVFEAERHSYGGLRMPWPIVHRASGLAAGAAALALAWLAWIDPGPGILALAMASTLLGLPLVAAAVTLLARFL
jgi:hypothetical protein